MSLGHRSGIDATPFSSKPATERPAYDGLSVCQERPPHRSRESDRPTGLSNVRTQVLEACRPLLRAFRKVATDPDR
jgi:hypothetical protein